MPHNQLDLILQKHLLLNILQFSDDIGQCARSITSQLREVIGCRAVALFERRPEQNFCLAGICPERRYDMFAGESAQKLIDLASQQTEPILIKPGEGELGALLTILEMQVSFVIPLRSGGENHGFLLLLDIFDLHNTDQILEAFKSLAGLLSLVMRNSFLYRNLEELVKKRTAELHESGQLNQQIFNSIHEGIVVYGKDLRIKSWNPFMEKLGKLSSEEVKGRRPEEIFPFLVRAGVIERLKLALAGQVPAEVEFEYEVNGDRGWAIDIPAPLHNEKGEIVGIVSTIRDITERKRAEAAIEAERQKHAETINRAARLNSLGILAGGIAHDFNNLLGGIYGFIDIARWQTRDPKTSEFLGSALKTMTRARALTEQLLTFSKGGTPVKKVESLFPFVEEIARFALSGANVSCTFRTDANLLPCNYDKNQIGQVVENLIINAQQAMPEGGLIEIITRNTILKAGEKPSLEAGNYLELAIKDNGTGMSKETIQHAFDPFFSTKPKGHGLGLATSYSIVTRHGGTIDVESEEGKGSTFKVYLPAVNEEVTPDSPEITKSHAGSGTFLVMDDEEVVLETIGYMLTSFGYKTVLKNNGRDAVEFFASEYHAGRKIVGMIFDLTVPGGLGGKEALEEIRKLCPATPAFVSSGYANNPIMANPHNYGFTASLTKPFRITELASLLNQHIKI